MPQTESPEYHVRTHPSSVEHWRHIVEIVAFVVAAAWGFYVFIYQEDIKPSSELLNVDITLNVGHTTLGNGEELISITPSWKNRGSAFAQVDGFILDVSGVSYAARDIAPWHNDVSKALFKVNPGLSTYSRGVTGESIPLYATYQRYQPLGAPGALRGLLEPGDAFSWTRSFVIPQGRFNAVRVTYSWCARRADDHRSIEFYPARLADGTYDVHSLLDAEGRSRHHFGVICGELASGLESGI